MESYRKWLRARLQDSENVSDNCSFTLSSRELTNTLRRDTPPQVLSSSKVDPHQFSFNQPCASNSDSRYVNTESDDNFRNNSPAGDSFIDTDDDELPALTQQIRRPLSTIQHDVQSKFDNNLRSVKSEMKFATKSQRQINLKIEPQKKQAKKIVSLSYQNLAKP